jgi:hypothetical protein
MNELERPTLGLEVELQIESARNQIDDLYWRRLAEMLVGTPAFQQMNREAYPTMVFPPIAKSPNKLRWVLSMYACSLFESEAVFYPDDLRMELWLRQLAGRITTKTMETVSAIEEANRERRVSFEHHGTTRPEMTDTIRAALEEKLRTTLQAKQQSPEASTVEQPPNPPAQRKRTKVTIHSPSAARKMEHYIQNHGLGYTEFAITVGTTDRTLRNFRRTGTIKRAIFIEIAKAMHTTREELLKD